MPEAGTDRGKTSRTRRGCAVAARLALVVLALAGGSLVALELTEPLSEPSACAACHEMTDAYASWEQSAHRRNPSGVTVGCIECHLPPRADHVSHFGGKAWSGLKDVSVHLFGRYDADAARQTARRALPDGRCLRCHDNLPAMPSSSAVAIVHGISLRNTATGRDHACVVCHSALHGPRAKPPAPKSYEEADNSYCYVCHVHFKTEEFVVQHLAAGVGCDRCHGESMAHADDEEHLTPADILFTKAKVNSSCMASQCHTEKRMRAEIGHVPWYAGARAGRDHCTDCHGKHRLEKRTRKWDKATRKLIWWDGDTLSRDPNSEPSPGGM